MPAKKKHHKHPPIKRPAMGVYHPCEWSIYGTNCSAVSRFYNIIYQHFSPMFNLLYVDADHNNEITENTHQLEEKQFISSNTNGWNDYDDKLESINYDAVFINGNHYPSSRQIIILDPEKKDSLERRLKFLNNIFMIIKMKKDQEIYDFLNEKIDSATPFILMENQSEWINILAKELLNAIPPLKALILAGGASMRMGHDKSQIEYLKGKAIELHLADICQQCGLDVFISKGTDFSNDHIDTFPVIRDRITGMGPFGALISAFIHEPETAWLVIACDLPFIEKTLIENLINNRNPSKIATAVKADTKSFPEPLIAIYEPRAKRRFLDFLYLGYNCPRKVLINSDVELMEVSDDSFILNVNTPEEKELAIKHLKKSGK